MMGRRKMTAISQEHELYNSGTYMLQCGAITEKPDDVQSIVQAAARTALCLNDEATHSLGLLTAFGERRYLSDNRITINKK